MFIVSSKLKNEDIRSSLTESKVNEMQNLKVHESQQFLLLVHTNKCLLNKWCFFTRRLSVPGRQRPCLSFLPTEQSAQVE